MTPAWLPLGAIALVGTLLAVVGADPPEYPDHRRLLVLRDAAGRERPIASPREWRRRRAHLLAHMQRVMGPLPGSERRVPLDPRVHEEVVTDRFVRRKIDFASEPGDRVPAYLFLPRARGRHPAVLCLHQTTRLGKAEPAGLGGRSDLHYALHLAERGYVTLAPDYVNFGEHRFDPYAAGYASGSMKAIWDNLRAVDLLQSLPEVDPRRIGVIGHSLGGHNALFTAAFDERLIAIVSNCGFTAFPAYYGGNLAGWSGPTYMPRLRSEFGLDPRRVPFDFHEIVAALAPRAFLAIAPVRDDNFAVEGVREVIDAARAVYRLFGASERLAALYPDAAHAFPSEAREVAYAWLDRWLGR